MQPYDDDSFDIPLDDELKADGDEPFVYDEDSLNLVPIFEGHPDGQEALKDIVEYVIERTDQAREDSEPYRERLQADNRLLTGELPEKDFPFKDAARLNIPLLLENTMRLHARLYSEIFGDFTNVVGVVPVSAEDEEVAQRMSLHDNWQMREDIPDFQRQSDRMLLMFLFGGDVTSDSYYDPQRRQNRHEMLTPDNFFVPYVLTSTFPDYSDCPYYTKLLTYGRHELQRLESRLEHVDDVIAREPAYEDDPEQSIAESANEANGLIMPSGDNYHAPYKLYQFEGWCHLLPNQDKDRFIQAIVDPYTRHILKLCIYEEVTWKDKVRMREMEAELEEYRRGKEEADRLRREQDEKMMEVQVKAIGEGVPTDIGQQAALNHTKPVEIPEAPDWVSDPDNLPIRPPTPEKRPIRMKAHGVNIEPLAGALGIGYGRIQSDFSRAATTMFNQHVDAATLQNAPLIFTSLTLPEDLQATPGKLTPVDAPVEELAKSIFAVPSPQPSPALMQGVEFITAMAQRSVQAPDVLSGEPGKSGETFRGIASRIEQATKQLSSSGRKFSGFLRQIYINNARLNSMHLEETAVKRLFDRGTKQFVDVQVAREMYERDYSVEIRADLKFSTEAQKKQEAMERLQITTQSPYLQTNQRVQYEALVDLFKSMGKEEWIPMLGEPPPSPQVFGGGTPPGAPQGAPGVEGPPQAPGPGGEAPGSPMGGQ